MVKHGTMGLCASAPSAATRPLLGVVAARIEVHLGLLAPSSTSRPALGLRLSEVA